ncbi:UNVERIFIED_ORG: hypothetical protein ABRZ91_001089 [Heyndrickxia coagulans]
MTLSKIKLYSREYKGIEGYIEAYCTDKMLKKKNILICETFMAFVDDTIRQTLSVHIRQGNKVTIYDFVDVWKGAEYKDNFEMYMRVRPIVDLYENRTFDEFIEACKDLSCNESTIDYNDPDYERMFGNPFELVENNSEVLTL